MSEVAIKLPRKFRFLVEPHRYKIAWGGRGGLKCLALGTQVIMFDGTLRNVEDVRCGELLMGPDSLPRTVLGTSRGVGPLYRVRQTSAMTYVVNDAHILSLKKSESSKRDIRLMPSGNPKCPRGRYPSWPDVSNVGVTVAASQSQRWLAHFRGYRAGLLYFPAQAITIDPYFLGVWLGDGTSREMRVTTADQEIVEACRTIAQEHGGDITVNKKDSRARDIGLLCKHGRKNLLWEKFKAYQLPNNKHIPHAYLANADKVRLELLAGLLDTDGTYKKTHHYNICQVNERLAHQIKFLADTLGFRTRIVRFSTHCANNGVRGIAWRVSIGGDLWRIPCRIPRKQARQEEMHKNKDWLLSQISIDRIDNGEWAGFSLDGDHLFLLADGTVTHNSWTYARALLIAAATTPLRILCAREIQKSIRDSVHTLLRDQISLLGLDQFYTVLDTEIRGLNGSLFIFAGLADHTVTSIKSFEGIDKVWIEEAQAVSKKSWDILVPTIRKEGSEIWISFNPELDTDETYLRFITVPPPGAVVVHTTYRDNPWFSAELEAERAHDEIMKPKDDYEHTWLGKCRAALSGAIFANEVAAMVQEGRITRVPYDPRLKVHTVWDLGWNDQTSIGMWQRGLADVRCIDYREYQFKRVDEIAGELKALPYNWGYDFLPWDGWTESRQTGKSDAQLLKSFGRRVKRVPNVENAQEARIRALRQLFPRIYVDAAKCARLIECWKRYRRNVPKHGEPASPIHDAYAHGCDQSGYMSLIVEQMTNEDLAEPRIHVAVPQNYGTMGGLGAR